MPRPVNPGTITVGTGLAAPESIEMNALVNPTSINDGLRAHIIDPSQAHMARAIGIEDAGGFYTSDHVEGALQEIGSGFSSTATMNGLVSGGTFSDVGLTITLDATVIRIGTERVYTGDSTVLANNATSWLYVDAGSGLLTSTTGAAPSITNPEHVLLWQIVTAGGVVTASTDARFFVPNLDRKVPFTIRASGTAEDRNSEACFESLDAAFLYLSTYYASGVIRKTRLIIRGAHTISATMIVPVSDVVFEGEDGAEFITGNTLAPMFDVNGQSRVQFKNLLFTCAHVASVAIEDSSATGSGLLVERCRFESGASNWARAVNLEGATGYADTVVRDCNIAASAYGIRVTRPIRTKVYNTVVTEAGAAGLTGISLGDTAVSLTTEGQSEIQGCHVTGFGRGVLARGTSNTVHECIVVGSDTGISVYTGSITSKVVNCDVTLDGTTGLTGVEVLSAPGTKVSNCTLSLTRAGWVAELPVGVSIDGSNDCVVSDCTLSGFTNTANNTGYGVLAANTCDRLTVRGGAISACATGVFVSDGGSNSVVVSGIDIRNSTNHGVFLEGPGCSITDCNIACDATIGVSGIRLDGANSHVTGCYIENTRAAWLGETPIGVQFNSDNCKISNTTIAGFNNDTDLRGFGLAISQAVGFTADNCTFDGCWVGVGTSATGTNGWSITGSRFVDIASEAISAAGVSGATITGNRISGGSVTSTAINITGTAAAPTRQVVITGNTIAACIDDGVVLSGFVQNAAVTGNQVDGYLSGDPYDPTAVAGIRIVSTGAADTARWITVTGNTVQRSINGIIAQGTLTNPVLDLQITGNIVHHCAVARATFALGSFSDPCKGIGVLNGGGISVLDNDVYGIGFLIDDAGVESAPTADTVTRTYGIAAWSNARVKVDGNTVRELHRQGGEVAWGILFTAQGNGAGAFASSGNSINGNSLAASVSSNLDAGIVINAGQAAAAPSPGPSTLTSLTVNNNTVRRTVAQGILVQASPAGVIQDIVINGNAIGTTTGADGVGISVVTLPLDGALAAGSIDGVRIGDNSISATNEQGVLVEAAAGSTLQDVAVVGNTITTPTLAGILIDGLSAPTAFGGFTVSDNRVTDGAVAGVLVRVVDLTLDGVSINSNVVGDSAGGAAAGVGIQVEVNATALARADLTNLVVIGNFLHVESTGILVDVEGLISGASIAGNMVEIGGAASPLTIDCTTDLTIAAQAYTENISVTGNTFLGGTNILVQIDQGQKFRNFAFTNNVRRTSSTYGLVVDISDASVGAGESIYNLNISDNAFDGTTDMAIRMLLGDATTANDPASNIMIDNNTFMSCNTAGVGSNSVIFVRTFGQVQNLSISGNEIRLSGYTDTASSGLIYLAPGNSSPFLEQNGWQVRNNKIIECTGLGIMISDHSAATEWSITDLAITGNVIRDLTNDGIRLDFADFGVVRNIVVSDNQIEDISGTASDTGIVFQGPTSGAPIEQLSFCRNTVSSVGSAGAEGAIHIGTSGPIVGLDVSGNILTPTNTFYGIFVTASNAGGPEDSSDFSICGNKVSTVVGEGIRVFMLDTSNLASVKVSDNTVTDASEDGILITVNTGDMTGVVVSGNTVLNVGQMGIGVHGTSGTGVLNNIIVDGNTVSGTTQDGIQVVMSASAGTIRNLSVTNNTIGAWGDGAAAVDNGIFVQSNEAVACTVSGNTLRGNQANARGLRFDIDGIIRSFAVSNNSVFMETNVLTQSMLWDTGLGADQIGMMFVGNTFINAANGVNFTGSFAPDRSLCAMNVERTSGGAGNWGTGGGGTFTNPFTNSTITPNQD